MQQQQNIVTAKPSLKGVKTLNFLFLNCNGWVGCIENNALNKLYINKNIEYIVAIADRRSIAIFPGSLALALLTFYPLPPQLKYDGKFQF